MEWEKETHKREGCEDQESGTGISCESLSLPYRHTFDIINCNSRVKYMQKWGGGD